MIEDFKSILQKIAGKAEKFGENIPVADLHNIVEAVLMGNKYKGNCS